MNQGFKLAREYAMHQNLEALLQWHNTRTLAKGYYLKYGNLYGPKRQLILAGAGTQ